MNIIKEASELQKQKIKYQRNMCIITTTQLIGKIVRPLLKKITGLKFERSMDDWKN